MRRVRAEPRHGSVDFGLGVAVPMASSAANAPVLWSKGAGLATRARHDRCVGGERDQCPPPGFLRRTRADTSVVVRRVLAGLRLHGWRGEVVAMNKRPMDRWIAMATWSIAPSRLSSKVLAFDNGTDVKKDIFAV